MMRVLIKQPGERPRVMQVEPGLESMQKIVGGNIECGMKAHGFFDGEDHLIFYVNEDGLRLELPLNLFRPSDGHPIVGAVVAVKTDRQGEDVSMTEEDAERVREYFTAMSLPGDRLILD